MLAQRRKAARTGRTGHTTAPRVAQVEDLDHHASPGGEMTHALLAIADEPTSTMPRRRSDAAVHSSEVTLSMAQRVVVAAATAPPQGDVIGSGGAASGNAPSATGSIPLPTSALRLPSFTAAVQRPQTVGPATEQRQTACSQEVRKPQPPCTTSAQTARAQPPPPPRIMLIGPVHASLPEADVFAARRRPRSFPSASTLVVTLPALSTASEEHRAARQRLTTLSDDNRSAELVLEQQQRMAEEHNFRTAVELDEQRQWRSHVVRPFVSGRNAILIDLASTVMRSERHDRDGITNAEAAQFITATRRFVGAVIGEQLGREAVEKEQFCLRVQVFGNRSILSSLPHHASSKRHDDVVTAPSLPLFRSSTYFVELRHCAAVSAAILARSAATVPYPIDQHAL